MKEELLDTELQITGAGKDEQGDIYLTSNNCNYTFMRMNRRNNMLLKRLL